MNTVITFSVPVSTAESTDFTPNAALIIIAKAYLHQIESCHLINRSIRNDSVLLWIDNRGTDEVGQQEIGTHCPDLPDLQSVYTGEGFVHLRHDPPQTMWEAVCVLFEITNKFVH